MLTKHCKISSIVLNLIQSSCQLTYTQAINLRVICITLQITSNNMQQVRDRILSRVLDGVWIGNRIYWTLIHSFRNYK
jgi:hypothetical protein